MTEERGNERYAERYESYEVYDRDGDKIGKVDELFVDENDQPEYIGVKMGLLGLGGSALIPLEATRVDEERGRIEVQAEKQTVKDAPSYGDNEEITPEQERRVYEHYGLTYGEAERGAYGEDEVRVPVTEEEVVTEKRPVAKEEIRVRKGVVEDEETVEEDVRREEVEIDEDDRTNR